MPVGDGRKGDTICLIEVKIGDFERLKCGWGQVVGDAGFFSPIYSTLCWRCASESASFLTGGHYSQFRIWDSASEDNCGGASRSLVLEPLTCVYVFVCVAWGMLIKC